MALRRCPTFWKRAAPLPRLNMICKLSVGAEEIARGDLATAVGASATAFIHVQPLDQVPTPESIGDTVDQAINRALDAAP